MKPHIETLAEKRERLTIAELRDEIDMLQEENLQLREAVAQAYSPKEIVVPIVWRLTPLEGAAFRHLVSRERATLESMMWALYGHRDAVPEPNICRVLVARLRRKLQPFGIQIFTKWGAGWAVGDRLTVLEQLKGHRQ